MSYILEALRKSERERSLGKVPTLNATTQSTVRRSPVWWLLLLMLTFVAAGMLWLRHDQTSRSEVVNAGPVQRAEPLSQSSKTSGSTETLHQEQASAGRGSVATDPAMTAITLNVISWSEDPARRFAMINQKIVREGEQLSENMSVRLIRPDQVIVLANGRELILKP